MEEATTRARPPPLGGRSDLVEEGSCRWWGEGDAHVAVLRLGAPGPAPAAARGTVMARRPYSAGNGVAVPPETLDLRVITIGWLPSGKRHKPVPAPLLSFVSFPSRVSLWKVFFFLR